jgi:hypothetical protein
MYFCSADSITGSYTSTIKHNLIDRTKIYNIRLDVKVLDPNNVWVNSPSAILKDEAGTTNLVITYLPSQLTGQWGCAQILNSATEFGWLCPFQLKYIATESNTPMKIINFSVVIKIDRILNKTVAINVNPVYETGCNCTVNTNITTTLEVYNEACTDRITSSVVFGSKICVLFYTTNPLAMSYYLNTTSIMIQYNTLTGLSNVEYLGVATTGCGTPGVCKKGAVYAIIPISMPSGNDVRITYTAQLVNGRLMLRLLANGDSIVGDGVQNVAGPFKVVNSGAGHLCVGLFTLLALLILFI